MTGLLWVGVVGVFIVAEVVGLLAFRKILNDQPGTVCFIAFILVLPMAAGLNGFYSVRRRLSSAGDEAISTLSVQFLITIVTAYVALLVCMEPIAKVLQHFQK
jgi:hypothetical protein